MLSKVLSSRYAECPPLNTTRERSIAMKRRLSTTLFLIAGMSLTVQAQVPNDEERKEGFVPLFYGTDFSGWQFGGGYDLPEKQPANWKVEEGIIKLSGGGGPHLGTQWDYDDFDMRFQWRAMREKYNSGFFIRSARKVRPNQINLAKGAEGRFFGGKMKGGKAVPELQNPPFEWNEWRVRIVGDTVTFWCNGKLAWEGTEFQSKRGHIGLQAEGAPLEIRNLRIKEIGWQYLGNPDMWPDAEKAAGLKLSDYVLRLEWKADKPTMAEINLRGAGFKKASVRLGDLENGSGGIVGFAAEPAKNTDNPAGRWNYTEVRVADGKATIWQNGVDVVKDIDLKSDANFPKTGGLTFAFKKTEFQFRNVRVKPLRKSTPTTNSSGDRGE